MLSQCDYPLIHLETEVLLVKMGHELGSDCHLENLNIAVFA